MFAILYSLPEIVKEIKTIEQSGETAICPHKSILVNQSIDWISGNENKH
jgi:hypothetical protein